MGEGQEQGGGTRTESSCVKLDVSPETSPTMHSMMKPNEIPPRYLDETVGRRLFGEVAEGRTTALAELYDLVAKNLFGLALWRTGDRAEAEDIVQEVFVKVAQQRHRLTEVRNPGGWLLTVTHRVALDRIRRRKVRVAESLEVADELVDPAPGPDQLADAKRVSRLLSKLPVGFRDVIYLRVFTGCSFAEIGSVLGVPTFTAASRYRRGLTKLRRLTNQGESR